MFRRIASVVLSCGVFVASANAQIGRRNLPPSEPGYWVGLSVGYLEGISTTDNTTGATWDFNYSAQIRATLEKTLQPGVSLGIAAGYSTASVTYSTPLFDPICPGSCQAHADITQYLAFLHGSFYGENLGLHGIYSAEAGVTQYGNFHDDATDTRLEPASGSYDFTFGFGGGAEYGLSRTTRLYLTFGTDYVLHPQAPGTNRSAAPNFYNIRAGFREGF
jgi:hypothetical protein